MIYHVIVPLVSFPGLNFWGTAHNATIISWVPWCSVKDFNALVVASPGYYSTRPMCPKATWKPWQLLVGYAERRCWGRFFGFASRFFKRGFGPFFSGTDLTPCAPLGGVPEQSGLVTLQELARKPFHWRLYQAASPWAGRFWEGLVLGFGSLSAWPVLTRILMFAHFLCFCLKCFWHTVHLLAIYAILCNSAVRKMQKITKHFWKRSSKKVILPDALSALAWLSGDTGASLAKLFDLNAPAAMKRGAPIPSHGALVPYSSIWAHPIRRQADSLPQHQQASGINAGVMLLKPSKASWMGIEEPWAVGVELLGVAQLLIALIWGRLLVHIGHRCFDPGERGTGTPSKW